jgi:phosphoribosyl 1,2-cyclic phosphodiesterase
MRVRLRGTRGSIAVPGEQTVVYGGNTTCIEVRCGDEGLIVLDAGTGIRSLGQELAASMPVTCHVFITHTHWDHISGLPFFLPLYSAGNSVAIYGPPDPLALTGIEAVLSRQLEYPHFPVRVAELKADIEYHTLFDRQTVDLGFATVSTLLMNHPAPDFGYRVDYGGKSLFFTGDHEPVFNVYHLGESEFEDYGRIVAERDRDLVKFISGVDLLIADAQYTAEEYEQKKGWGHSSAEWVLDLARRTGAKHTLLTHHDAVRTDADLDAILARLQEEWKGAGLRFDLAREGRVIEL